MPWLTESGDNSLIALEFVRMRFLPQVSQPIGAACLPAKLKFPTVGLLYQ